MGSRSSRGRSCWPASPHLTRGELASRGVTSPAPTRDQLRPTSTAETHRRPEGHHTDLSLTAMFTQQNGTLLGRQRTVLNETAASRAAHRDPHTEATNDMIFVPDER